jgi:hypothetical protein
MKPICYLLLLAVMCQCVLSQSLAEPVCEVVGSCEKCTPDELVSVTISNICAIVQQKYIGRPKVTVLLQE